MESQGATYSWPHSASRPSKAIFKDLLLVTPFIALFCVQLAHHNLWRDELNAFAIAWASPTLSSLFHNIHYDGHPWLWYFILWVLSRFTVSIVAFKLLQACLGTASLLLIALASPFRRWEKALILCGYFIVFEYTVMVRMYGVLLLLLLIYCWRRINRPHSPVVNAVLLGLIASADSMGMVLSGALLLEYAFVAFKQRRSDPLFSRRRASLALVVYTAMAAFAAWSAHPAPDFDWAVTGKVFEYARSASHLFEAFERYTVFAFVSVRSPGTGYFWDPEPRHGSLKYIIPLLVVLACLYFSLRRHGNLILLVAVTLVLATLFGHLIYMGSVRHYGVVFLAFLAAMWILRATSPDRRLSAAAYFLLTLSALSGVWATIASWRHPFSNAKPAAAWIVANHLNDMPLVAQVDFTIAGLAEHLHRPFYMIDCECVDTHMVYSGRYDDLTAPQAAQRVLNANNFYHGQPLLLADAQPLSPAESEAIQNLGLRVKPLAAFTGAEEPMENIYLYRIARK